MLHIAGPKFPEKAVEMVADCVRTSWVSSQAPTVREFEQTFASMLGVKYAVACSSGTTALHLALRALDIGPWDEVLVPSFTFIATVNPVMYCNAIPVFCDIDPETWGIDLEDAMHKVTPRTKAIIPAHINGYPCHMGKIKGLALQHSLVVVEDACQALGSTWEGQALGSIGDIGCFSFFANKTLTTGEGGMAVTNSEALDKKMRMLRDHGRIDKRFYLHDVIGYNYRMTALQAALGLSQLEYLHIEVARRRRLNKRWREVLGNTQPENPEQCPWLYHMRLRNGVSEAIDALEANGIEAKPFYTPVHQQRPYWDLGVKLPVTERLQGIMLPLHEGVNGRHIRLAQEALAEAVAV